MEETHPISVMIDVGDLKYFFLPMTSDQTPLAGFTSGQRSILKSILLAVYDQIDDD